MIQKFSQPSILWWCISIKLIRYRRCSYVWINTTKTNQDMSSHSIKICSLHLIDWTIKIMKYKSSRRQPTHHTGHLFLKEKTVRNPKDSLRNQKLNRAQNYQYQVILQLCNNKIKTSLLSSNLPKRQLLLKRQKMENCWSLKRSQEISTTFSKTYFKNQLRRLRSSKRYMRILLIKNIKNQ